MNTGICVAHWEFTLSMDWV